MTAVYNGIIFLMNSGEENKATNLERLQKDLYAKNSNFEIGGRTDLTKKDYKIKRDWDENKKGAAAETEKEPPKRSKAFGLF